MDEVVRFLGATGSVSQADLARHLQSAASGTAAGVADLETKVKELRAMQQARPAPSVPEATKEVAARQVAAASPAPAGQPKRAAAFGGAPGQGRLMGMPGFNWAPAGGMNFGWAGQAAQLPGQMRRGPVAPWMVRRVDGALAYWRR